MEWEPQKVLPWVQTMARWLALEMEQNLGLHLELELEW
jgi:hypothetical protein